MPALTTREDAPVVQLTRAGHANFCMYFTHDSWASDTELVFTSDRAGGLEFFTVNVESGRIRQLTDGASATPNWWAIAPSKRFVLYLGGPAGDELRKVDLASLDEETVATRPARYAGWRNSIVSIAPDDDRFYVNCNHPSFFPSNVFTGSVARGTFEPMFPAAVEASTFFDHVQICPADPSLLQVNATPAGMVGKESTQRMWLFDARTGKLKPFYKHKRRPPGIGPLERVGHETWLPDGKHLAFVVRRDEIKACAIDQPFGKERAWTVAKGPNFWHASACPVKPLLCADTMWADTGLWLVECTPGARGRAIPLCLSDSQWQDPVAAALQRDTGIRFDQAHPHPGWSPDGRRVQFTSFRPAEGAVHLFVVEVPAGA